MNDEEQSQGVVTEEVINLDAQDNQVEPAPSSDQKQDVVIDNAPAEDQGEDDQVNESSTNPRTEQRLKELLEENKRLKAETNRKQYGTNVFDTFRPQVDPQVNPTSFTSLNQQQVDSITQQYVDEDGNVDLAGIDRAIKEATQRAIENAQRTAEERIARFEESQQVKEAHAVYPELDPLSAKFDSEFYEDVSNRLLGQMVRGTGKTETLLEAATYVKGRKPAQAPVNLDKEKEKAVAEYKKAQEKRQQGPVESGNGAPRQTSASLDELREKTRQGDANAIRERLKAVGVISDQ